MADFLVKIHFHEKNAVHNDLANITVAFKTEHFEMLYEKQEFERILFTIFHDKTMAFIEMYRVKKIELGIETDYTEELVYSDKKRN